MPYMIGTAKHPQTGKKTLLVQAQVAPEPWPDVVGLLRTLKAEFPKEFRQIQYEILPPNGKRFESDLILPEGVANGRAAVRGAVSQQDEDSDSSGGNCGGSAGGGEELG